MSRMDLTTEIAGDGRTTLIKMRKNGEVLGRVMLTAEELESFINQLSDHRAQMSEEVPRDLDPRSHLPIVDDPVWRLRRVESGGSGLAMALRHPGLGWLAFLFPDHEAKAIARFFATNRPDKVDR